MKILLFTLLLLISFSARALISPILNSYDFFVERTFELCIAGGTYYYINIDSEIYLFPWIDPKIGITGECYYNEFEQLVYRVTH